MGVNVPVVFLPPHQSQSSVPLVTVQTLVLKVETPLFPSPLAYTGCEGAENTEAVSPLGYESQTQSGILSKAGELGFCQLASCLLCTYNTYMCVCVSFLPIRV